MPKETLEITPLLYDQADEIIKDSVSIEIYDTKDKLIFSDSVKSNTISKFTLATSTLPGSYTIRLSSNKLKSRTNFQVGTTRDLIINLVNQSIVIENIGNTKFETPVKIMLNPNQVTFVKKISLKPQKSTSIDLTREISTSGIYDISISYNDKAKEFHNVTLDAKKRVLLDVPYYMLALAFFAVFAYLLYIKVLSNRKSRGKEEYEKAHAKKELKRLREMKSKDKETGSRFSYRNINKRQAADDFKHSYVDRVKEAETRDDMFGFMDRK